MKKIFSALIVLLALATPAWAQWDGDAGSLEAKTVATLPTAATSADTCYLVINGLNATDCTEAGGAYRVICCSNGTAWSAPNGGAGTFEGGTITGTVTFSGVATDMTSATNEDVTIAPNGTGDVELGLDADTDLKLGATGVVISTDNDGAVTITGASAGYDENITINLDDIENAWDVTTTSGVTLLRLFGGDLVLAETATGYNSAIYDNNVGGPRIGWTAGGVLASIDGAGNTMMTITDAGTTGNVAITGTTTSSGLLTASANLDVKNGVNPGVVKLYEGSGGGTEYVGIDVAAALSASLIWTLPGTDAANCLFQSDGSANLSCTTTLNISTLNLPSSDADPGTTAGQIRHDTTVTGKTNGAAKWYDGAAVRTICDTGDCEVPSGATAATGVVGEVAVDTTDDQFKYYGAAERVLSYKETRCIVIENLAAADDNYEFFMASQAITIVSVGCHCRGTCTTGATFTLEDRAGNAMTITGTNPTCSTTTGNATFAAVTAANGLVAGEGLAFDVTNAVSPETDEYTLCIVYTVDAQ